MVPERISTTTQDDFPAAAYETKPLSFLVKQVTDFFLAALVLLLLSPVLGLIGLLIRLESSGSVFFRQRRVGRFNRPFTVYKFRTMIEGADKVSLEINQNDPRITRIGRFLRVTSLDELPQLINVLRGEMSLIGPRPLLPGTIEPGENRRQDMKPGLTSYPVLFGRHEIDWDTRVRLDIWYVTHWSLWLDLKIFLGTFPVIFSRRNVSESRFRPGAAKPPIDQETAQE